MKETYKNILELIEMNETILNNCKDNLKLIERFIYKQGPKGYPTGTSYVDADCIRGGDDELHEEDYKKLIDEIGKLNNMINLQENILNKLYKTKKEIDDKLNNLSGIEYEVAYLKLVEGMSLYQIAAKLHISEIYAKKISAKL